MGAVIGKFHRERHGQLAAGIDSATEYIGQGMTGLGTEIPCLYDGRYLVDPLHLHGIAADKHQYQIGINGRQFGDKPVLPERQAVLYPVAGLTSCS